MDNIIRGGIELGAVKFKAAGDGSLAYFVILCVLIVVAPLVSLCCIDCLSRKNGDKEEWKKKCWVVQMIIDSYNQEKELVYRISVFLPPLLVASLYYFGDNIDYFAWRYGEAFECDENCLQKLVVVKQVFLGVAILFIHTIPFLDHEPRLDEKGNVYYVRKRGFLYVLNIVNVLVKVDMIYSIITTTIILPGGDCSVIETLSFTFFSLATVIGWAGILWQTIQGACVIYKRDDAIAIFKTCSTWIGVALLLVSLPLFLLADNQQPLQCGLLNTTIIPPDAGRGNRTVDMDSNDAKTLSELRLGFTSTAFVSVIIFVLFVTSRLKKLLDHQHKEDDTAL